MLDNAEPAAVLYLDFAKAFDIVPHERFLRKLSGYGVGGNLLGWIQDFLVGRQQQVVIEDMASS